MHASNLNSSGQAFLGVVGSFAVNAVVHPLCTIKNRLMANQRVIFNPFVGLKVLYRGYTEICLTESTAYATSYVVNGILKKREIGPLTSAILAGIVSTPVVAVGEALMLNRQVNGGPLSSQILRRSLCRSGLVATLLREVPFNVAIFSFAPAIEKRMHFTDEFTKNAIAGLGSGIICGLITAPADKIKTLVQANELSIMDSTRMVVRALGESGGRRRILAEGFTGVVYIGLSVAILNVFNNQLPQHFPNQMKE